MMDHFFHDIRLESSAPLSHGQLTDFQIKQIGITKKKHPVHLVTNFNFIGIRKPYPFEGSDHFKWEIPNDI